MEPVENLRSLKLPIADLVDVVVSDHYYANNEVFDYLWSLGMGETLIYKLVSKCFFFQSEYVVRRLMTIKFPPSLIIIFIKQTKLGLSDIMLEFLHMNKPSGTDVAYLLYDSPQYLTEGTMELFFKSATTVHQVMAVLDNARGLSDNQRERLLSLCVTLALD